MIPFENEPFNGDVFAQEEFANLIKDYKVKTVIETGTYKGITTKYLSSVSANVISIEIGPKRLQQAQTNNKGKNNIQFYLGNSPEILKQILPIKEKCLFFLDAHWNNYNPLLDELKVIAEHKMKPIIAIHDFKVPDNKELGYDSYKGQDYEFAWIEKSLEAIYGKGGYKYYYNQRATGAKRGIIYIVPLNVR